MKLIDQIRSSVRHLNPEAVRREAARPLSVELDVLAHDPHPPVQELLSQCPELSLALARRFPAFRGPVVKRIIRDVSRENALFALFTALPSVVPSLVSLGWTAGEVVSDTVVLTVNQVRMAFLIAAANDKPVGFFEQKAQIGSIILGAFGWRSLARELVGRIPFGEGLIPKAAVAYAGTYVVGQSLERYHRLGRWLTSAERKAAYREALRSGKEYAQKALRSRRAGPGDLQENPE